MDVRLGVAAFQQLLGQSGVVRNVLEADRPGGDPVEVGADADVVDAGDLDDVVDVIGDVGDRPALAVGWPSTRLRRPWQTRPGRDTSARSSLRAAIDALA